jgi:hypothetical protein
LHWVLAVRYGVIVTGKSDSSTWALCIWKI